MFAAVVGDALLHVSKLLTGIVTLEYSHIDVARLCRRLVGQFEPVAARRKITLRFDSPRELIIDVDVDQFERILLNLLANASTCTPDGGTIRCAIEQRDGKFILMITCGPVVATETPEGGTQLIVEMPLRDSKARSVTPVQTEGPPGKLTGQVGQDWFRRLVDANIMGVVTIMLDGKVTEANEAFLNMIGYSREDFAAGKIELRKLTTAESRAKFRRMLKELREVGIVAPAEHEYRRKDGTRLPALVGAVGMESMPPSATAFFVDLTQRKRSEALVAVQYGIARILAQSESLAQAAPRLLEQIGRCLEWDFGELWTVAAIGNLQCIATWHGDPTQFANLEMSTRRTKFSPGEGLPGRVWQSRAPAWITDLETERDFARVPVARGEGLQSGFGFPIMLGDEVLGTITFFNLRRMDPDVELLETMAGVGRQIGQFVDRKRGERALRESNERFRTMAEAIPQIMWTATPEGAVDYFNRRWYEYTGTAGGMGWTWESIIHPDDLGSCLERWTEALRTGGAYEIEHRFKRHDGVYRWFLGRGVPLRDADGHITKWVGTATDIDDQKQAQQALREVAAIVESSDDAIFSKTLDGTIRSWNAGAERMYGYTAAEIIGRNVQVLEAPDRAGEVSQLLMRLRRGERIQHVQTKRIRKDGTVIDVALTLSPIRDAAGNIIGASTIARDVSEIRRAEVALRNAEKLATVGRLAATIAHEINNPLEAVSNVLYLLGLHSMLDRTAADYVSLAQQEVARIAHIVRQTLGFYRESQAPVPVDVKQLLENVIELYGRKLELSGITIQREYDAAPEVTAFPAEMRQVFSNLIVNAVEAMPNGGRLRIRIRASRNSGLAGIRITIGDTGAGIKPQHRSELFEPFFTTKGEKGTGLGLWVSNGIVLKHGGRIAVRTCARPGSSGTVFSVFLPLNGMPAASDKIETGKFATDMPQSA